MTLLDAWQEGGITVPWSRLAKSNRKKLFAVRKDLSEYYLIGGERPKNNHHDYARLIILEVNDNGKGRILIDIPEDKQEKYHEDLREFHINIDTLRQALGFVDKRQQQKETTTPAGVVYDPEKKYVLSREKSGRPRRVLSDEEKENIRQLREKGMGINAIAKKLGINNRRVMEFCKTL